MTSHGPNIMEEDLVTGPLVPQGISLWRIPRCLMMPINPKESQLVACTTVLLLPTLVQLFPMLLIMVILNSHLPLLTILFPGHGLLVLYHSNRGVLVMIDQLMVATMNHHLLVVVETGKGTDQIR